jgi:amino acid adenylation domain-containing protein
MSTKESLKSILPLPVSVSQYARLHPKAVAIESDLGVTTYEELERASLRLAHQLRMFCASKRRVLIMAPRSHELIIGILAALRSNVIFATVSPDTPSEVLANTLQVYKPDLILSTREFLPSVEQSKILTNTEVLKICFRQLQEDLTAVESLVIADRKDDSYVFFTSGSTGLPKAILGSHKGLAQFLNWESKSLAANAQFRVSFLTAVGFDPSLRDIFLPLTNGGTVVIPEASTVMNPPALLAWLTEKQITHIHMIPTLFRETFVNGKHYTDLPDLKAVLLAGEVLRTQDVQSFFERHKNQVQVFNLYGPTETTLAKFSNLIEPDDLKEAIIPVGHAIEFATGHLLDDQMRPVDGQDIGEVYIQTPFRSLGYLDSDEQNKAAFITHKFANGATEVLYKTGDLARRLANGKIQVIGRKDNQIKIRGMRIEIGEIENAILKVNDIEAAAVVFKKDPNDGYRLVAFYVGQCLPHFVSQQLLTKLPAHARPHKFIALEKLPRLTNGKVDRRALLNLLDTDEEIAIHDDRHRLDQRLKDVWGRVLRRKTHSFSIDETFFTLGGHSLLIAKVISEIEIEFRVKITFAQFFAHPTIRALSDIISSSVVTQPLALGPKVLGEKIPLSRSQQRLYLIHRLNPQSLAYNVSNAYILRGQFDFAAFERAFAQLIQRHGVLRVSFIEENEQVFQKIHDPYLPSIDLIRVGSMDLADLKTLHLQKSARIQFDLSSHQLCDVGIYEVAPDIRILQITMPHIVVDAWSIEVLLEDLANLYKEECLGANASSLNSSVSPMKFFEFCLEENTALESERSAELQKYWLQHLQARSDEPVFKRVTKAQLEDTPSMAFSDRLHAEEWAQVRAFCQKQGITPYILGLSAYALLLARFARREELIIGSPVANRENHEYQNALGCFVNFLPLAVELKKTLSTNAYLNQVRTTVVNGYDHQIYPFEKIVSDLGLRRELGQNPLFDTAFVYQAGPGAALNQYGKFNFAGLEAENLHLEHPVAKFNLTLTLAENHEGLFYEFVFAECAIEKSVGASFRQYWKRLLFGLMDDLDRDIHEIPLLDVSEEAALLKEHDHTHVSYPKDSLIHDIFANIAMKFASQTALSFSGKTWTYAQLENAANKVAKSLVSANVKRQDIVAVALLPSFEMIAALLGVMKSGATYLPIDPTLPSDRIQFILNDSRPTQIVTWSGSLALPKVEGASQLNIDQMDLSEPQKAPDLKVQSSDPAYIIYTSGTTGGPKGTIITHENVVRLFFNDKALFDFNSSDVWMMFHSFAFDFSVWEMYGALLFGGRLVLIDRETARDPKIVRNLIRDERVTILNQTPSAFYNLSKEDEQSEADLSVRYVIFGGEALAPGRLEHWKNRYPACQLVNMYGITETTVHVTYKELNLTHILDGRSNIGVAIPTLGLAIVDEKMRPVPQGFTGEILVTGAGVGLGYLNRPELTSQRFPTLTDIHPQRCYRSGDLGRLMENGELEYLSRMDNQIQLRGFRVELGEIQSHLDRHPEVSSSIVVARKDQDGDLALHAFYVSVHEIAVIALRNFCSQHLPPYMIPSHFTRIEKIPLTGNGKVDLKALPQSVSNAKPLGQYVPAQNDFQADLQSAWAEVLRIDLPSVQSGFFEIGGDSIKALRVVSKMSGRLKLTDIFKWQTIEEIDMNLRTEDAMDSKSHIVSLLPTISDSNLAVVCVPFGGGDPVNFYKVATHIRIRHPNADVYAVRMPGEGPNRVNVDVSNWLELAQRCAAEINEKVQSRRLIIYGHCVGSGLAIEITRQLEGLNRTVHSLVVAATLPPNVDPAAPVLDVWKDKSDSEILDFLATLGSFQEDANEEMLKVIIKNFRKDVYSYREYFHHANTNAQYTKPKVSGICLMGTHDLSAKDYKENFGRWGSYIRDVKLLEVPKGDHYFNATMADKLAEIILENSKV